MTEEPKSCWCGKPTAYEIKQKVPSGEIIIYVCGRHRDDTYSAVKWHLVAEGLWAPRCLTMERLQ